MNNSDKVIITCKSIEKIGTIAGDIVDILKIRDGLEEYVVFENYAVAQKFLNTDIEGIERIELVNGQPCKILSEITLYKKINILAEETNFKLYSDENFYNESNVVFSEDEEGTVHEAAIVYSTKAHMRTSAAAIWMEFTIIDSMGRISTLRWFDPAERNDELFSSKYIVATITKSKSGYGYQTNYVDILSNEEIGVNPNVTIAQKYLLNIIEQDSILKKFANDSHILDKLEVYSDDDNPELGAYTISLAREVYLAISIDNLIKGVDSKLLIRGLFASYCFTFSQTKEPVISKTLRNIYNISRFELCKDRRILNMLDINPPKILMEREALYQIKDLAKSIYSLDKDVRNYVTAEDHIWKGAKKK